MKILMIGAHQDDSEFRCGGITHKYVQMGYEVRFLSMTDGSGGHHIMGPDETRAARAKESAAVAEFLGIRYDVWDNLDANLVADLATRKKLIRYIREYSPDLIICHRTNDYHADHRASGLLVQDASYLLTVPNECPDVPAMRFMPVIMHYSDRFQNPPFEPTVVVDTDAEIDVNLHIAHINKTQVYEWLPYNSGDIVPESEEERKEWLKGMVITEDTTDEEILAAKRGYAVRYAKVASKYRKELIERYGEEKGRKIRYAEAFQLSEYGAPLTPELMKKLFPF